MKGYVSHLSITILLSLPYLSMQVALLPQSTVVERMENLLAQNEQAPVYPGSPTYEPQPGELTPVNIDFGKPILNGRVREAVIPLRPEPDVANSYTGYVSFGGEALSLDGVTFTGGPDESSYTTLCMFYRMVETNSGEIVPEVTEVFAREMKGSATNVNGIGCAALPNDDGGGVPGRDSNVIDV